MLDNAGIKIAQGENISCEEIDGVNDNMSETNLTPSEYRKIYLYKKKNSLA